MNTTYVTGKEIAVQVRKDLKAKFPGIKFSVTSELTKVSVSYVDGPIVKEVEAEVQKYCGRRDYDPNYGDYRKNVEVEFQGEMRKTFLEYIFVHRECSPAFAQEVFDFVKKTYANKEDDGVEVHISSYSGNAYFHCGDYTALHDYREIADRCNSFSSVAEQEKQRREKHEAEMEAYRKQKAIDQQKAVEQQEEESDLIKKIVPLSIEEMPSDNKIFVEGLFSNLNKLSTIGEYKKQCVQGNYCVRKCLVERVVRLSPEVYDIYTNSLLFDFDWLAGKGGTTSDADVPKEKSWSQLSETERQEWIKHSYYHCVLVIAEGKIPLLLDPQGYNYARYVGFAESGEVDKIFNQQQEKVNKILEFRRDRLEQKKSRRLEAYQKLQQKHEKLSNQSYQNSSNLLKVIPMGQPILIGHHSERGHRSRLRRADNAMRSSIQHQKASEYYQGKIAAMEGNQAIYSDDPDAIAKLKAKLDTLEKLQERNKVINKIVKSRNKAMTQEKKILQLMQFLNCSEAIAKGFFNPDFCGRIGIPDYELTNNGAEIRRLKARIQELEAKLQKAVEVEDGIEEEPVEGLKGVKIVKNHLINRLQIIFDSKPAQNIRAILRTYGFRRSPSEGAWQRHLNNSSIFASQVVIKKIQEIQP